MTSGAGSLNIRIGGPAMYHGKMHNKIHMGSGELAKPEDIPRACRLVVRTSLLWCGALILLSSLNAGLEHAAFRSQLMIHHGGKLLEFSARFDIPVEDWLDLSTGVSPYTYPVSDIPTNVWNRLPEDEDGLIEAAQRYYQSPHLYLSRAAKRVFSCCHLYYASTACWTKLQLCRCLALRRFESYCQRWGTRSISTRGSNVWLKGLRN